MRPAIILITITLLALPAKSFAAVLHVPGDYPTIQDAISAADPGDIVLVAQGTYVENIDFLGKAITVRSEDGPGGTVIDGSSPPNPNNGSVVSFKTGEGQDSVLDGFTLANGAGSNFNQYGGGIYCYFASPTVINNVISYNSAAAEGGGIYIESSFAVIRSNTIKENFAKHYGGGIRSRSGAPHILKNLIEDNSTGINGNYQGGGISCRSGGPVIRGNRIRGNTTDQGGGIHLWQTISSTLENNLLHENTAFFAGGGIFGYDSPSLMRENTLYGNSSVVGGGLYCGAGCILDVSNSILWNNSASWKGEEIYIANNGTLSIAYSDVEGGQSKIHVEPGGTLNWGPGMIDADPLFAAAGSGDYHLSQAPPEPGVVNPCVDTGDPSSPLIKGTTRTDGVHDQGTIDMGYHYPLTYFLVPEFFLKIQEAIDEAADGDQVFVAPGSYLENIDFTGKAVTVKSDEDRDPLTHDPAPDQTAIDGNQAGSVVIFENNEEPDSVLEGFTLRNGKAAIGGGIRCIDASPTLRGNIVTQNTAKEGGGIGCSGSAALILNNVVEANTGDNYGAGIHCGSTSSTAILGNTIRDNLGDSSVAGGGISAVDSNMALMNNLIYKNTALTGGGFYLENSKADSFNNTFHGNSAGAGGAIFLFDASEAWVKNCILWNDTASLGPEGVVANSAKPCTLTIKYSTVEGGKASFKVETGGVLKWDEKNMLEADPLLADPANDDLHLIPFSPCINRGTNEDAPPIDVDGDPRPCQGATDMGADEYIGTHPFEADTFVMYVSQVNVVNFALHGGYANRNRAYLILGSVTGTIPGTPLPGGQATLPMNWDGFTNIVLAFLNTPIFFNFLGMLDGVGDASAQLNTVYPLPGGLAGIVIRFAYTLNNPYDFVSNPINIEIQ